MKFLYFEKLETNKLKILSKFFESKQTATTI